MPHAQRPMLTRILDMDDFGGPLIPGQFMKLSDDGARFELATISTPVTSVNTLTGDVILSTTNIPEGANLYFTAGRAAAVAPVQSVNSLTGNVVLSTTNVAEGTNPYFTNARSIAAILTTAGLAITPTWTGLHTFAGNVLVKGSVGTLLIEDRGGAGVETWNVFSVGGALSFYTSSLTAFTIARDQVTGQARVAVGPIMAAAFSVTAPAANVVGFAVKVAPLQSANAFEVRDSNAVVLLSITPNGTLYAPSTVNILAAVDGSGTISIKGKTRISGANNYGLLVGDLSGVGAAVFGDSGYDVGFGFNTGGIPGSDIIYPVNHLGITDNVANLGQASARFKCLYASQGQFLTAGATSKPLVVQGAASQLANLTEWQNSSGTVLSFVSSTGLIVGAGLLSASSVDASILGPNAGNQLSIRKNSVGGPNVLIVPTNANDNGVTLLAPYSTGIAAIVKGAASQSANLLEIQDNNNNVLTSISENGYFTTRKNTAPADAELSAGEAAYWFDSTNGAAKFMVKAKQADGTVRTGNLALIPRPGPYTPTNVTTDRAYDANSTSLDEIADVLGTLIADLQSLGLIS